MRCIHAVRFGFFWADELTSILNREEKDAWHVYRKIYAYARKLKAISIIPCCK